MTTHAPTTTLPPDTSALLARAAAAGVALGVADLVLIQVLPYPLADLANSSAVWALAAFVAGRLLRTTPAAAAAAGVVLLLVAVETYYVAAVVVDMASPTVLVSPSAIAWSVMAVVAGAGFGAAGAWSVDADRWRSAAAVALASGVVLAEAWVRRGWEGTSLLTAALGLVVLVAASRGPAEVARAAALVLPATLLCLTGFAYAGF